MIKSSELLYMLMEHENPCYEDLTLTIKTDKKAGEETDNLAIEMKQMYEYVSFDFEFLSKISELLQTKNININNDYYSEGCETCDHGSSYVATFYVKNCKNKILIDDKVLTEPEYRQIKSSKRTPEEIKKDNETYYGVKYIGE